MKKDTLNLQYCKSKIKEGGGEEEEEKEEEEREMVKQKKESHSFFQETFRNFWENDCNDDNLRSKFPSRQN